MNLDINEARGDGVAVTSAGPYAMQIICTSLQTDNHASISSFFTGWMLFLMPNVNWTL